MTGTQELSATQMAAAIRTRKLSAREALESHISAIEQRNPAINAVVTTDFERAHRLAAAADEQTVRGEGHGLLHGLPMTHKDTFNTAGLRSTQGSRALEDHVPDSDDLQIDRLSAAGAIRTGKTNVPEFGAGSHTFNDLFGTTVNPYDTGVSAGGSSGGVAAVVASRIQAFGDGSDMGGSLRIPAAFCNVFGFRPSYGVIPMESPVNAHSWLSRSGPMARTVEDLALFMRASAGPTRLPTPSPLRGADFVTPLPDLRGVKIGYSFDFGIGLPVEPEIVEVLRAQLTVFEEAGAILEEATIDFSDADEVFQTTRAFDFATGIGPLLERFGEVIKPEVIWNVELGLNLAASEIISANAARTRLERASQHFFDRYDAFLSPATQVLPFDASWRWPQEIAGTQAETYLDWMRSACLLSAASLPVIAMPGGFTGTGLPVGWQLAANHYRDVDLLNWAAAYEQATGFAARPPSMLG
jgi:amidase